MEISRDQLKAMISSAYEEGWRGFLEMKEDYASAVVGKFAAEQPQSISFAVGDLSNANTIPPYYYYTTTTSAPSITTLRGEEVI